MTVKEAYQARVKEWANGRIFVLAFRHVDGERGELTCEVCGSRRPTILYIIFEVLDRQQVKVELGAMPPMRHCDPHPIFVGACCKKALSDLGLLKTRNRVGYDFPLDGRREIYAQRHK